MAALLREAMKVPISNRLLLCAEFVPRGSRAADIGTDHGYLSIYLLREGICPFVTAADLREQPLQKARENAARFGVSEKMRFFLSDGLQGIPPDAADTIIMAGMGGDLMVRILEAAPWVCDDRYTLICSRRAPGRRCGSIWRSTALRLSAKRLRATATFSIPFCAQERDICPH